MYERTWILAVALAVGCGKGAGAKKDERAAGDTGAEKAGKADDCFSDRAGVSSLRVTTAGAVSRDRVVVAAAAAADRDATRKALAPRCQEDSRYQQLVLALEPDADAAVALAIIDAARGAGYHQLEIEPVDSAGNCRLQIDPASPYPEPPAKESATLSVLVEPGSTWVSISRVGEHIRIGPGDRFAMAEATILELAGSVHFVDRDDAELAAAPGTPAGELDVLWPLCEEFPAFTIVAPDALTAPPPR